MGRSSTSCFKIISCGGDSVEKDDLEAPESKSASDKRGWSFRKRSARHRVLSNTVISETPSSLNKESPESASVNFQTLANPSVPEKISAIQQREYKPEFSSVNTTESETVDFTEDDTKAVDNFDESVIILIQSAIRGFLAHRALLKLKNVVKLQAAVRGHLERRHAVGTLRCVQAIIKMQALVRARRARLLLEGSCTEEKEKEILETKPNQKVSIEKLLSNGFARQLLETTPRTKPINIKCDPLRSDSAWNWLERWMSVSSKGVEQQTEPESKTEDQERQTIPESKTDEKDQEQEQVQVQEQEMEMEEMEHSTSQSEIEIPSKSNSETRDLKSSIEDTAVPSENEENLITYDANNFDFQACRPTLSSITDDDLEKSQHENVGISILTENSLDSLPNQTKQSDSISQTDIDSHYSKPELEIEEQPKRSSKRSAPEELETEGKKPVFGSRKVSNPAFIAAQSKFEELSSTANSAKSISSSNQDGGVESNADVSSPVIQLGGSECGTELSISSTLDSRDGSEVEAIEAEHGTKVSEEESSKKSTQYLDVEPKGEESTLESDSYSTTVQPEKLVDNNVTDGEPISSVIPADSSEVKLNSGKSVSDVQIELGSGTGHQAYKSSPEASPRSHLTVPESQGTPSSQVSVKAKRLKGDKSGSHPKRRSLSAGKRSPSNPDRDSGARNSLEQLPKDQKNGKTRSSFGSSKPDQDHQEPRDSGSSNSLPSYMQATESARAKAHATSSPRSSPDVQDKEIYIKKRHSLPGANGRQGSPRIQRSMSQAQQGAKGNGSLSNERKWQR